ncbi:MAG: helix-turn-helix transcriptional regulator [Bacteroidales bacterium]|nr:helix-turn-helix transcriptional regulator [Bacteroidales bacterium]
MSKSYNAKTTAEISAEIRNYFESNRVSQKQVAAILDVTQSTVSVYVAGRPFSNKIAKKWSDAFGFSPSFLVSGTGTLVSGATKSDPYPRTVQLTSAQTRLVANGYNFMSKEMLDEKEVPIAAYMRRKYSKKALEAYQHKIIDFPTVKDNHVINVGDIYKWQNDALKDMKEQMAKKEARLVSIESIIGDVIGLGADTVSALPTSAISTLLIQATAK